MIALRALASRVAVKVLGRMSGSAETAQQRPAAHRGQAWEGLLNEFRPTVQLAIPLVSAELGWMSMGIVDTIMVGRLPNSAVAIGAVSLGQGLYYTTAIFGSGLLLGMDTLVSHAFGRDDLDDARHSLANSIVLALLLTPVLVGIVALWPPLMRHFGISGEILREMDPFVTALNWSTLPLLMYFALRRYLQAVNIVKPITFALISANIVNAVGNWVFIYGHWGFRAYGVPGSGWSTCVARLYMAGVLVAALLYKRKQFRLFATRLRVDIGRIGRLLALGFPAATQILLEVGVFSTVTAICGKLGAVSLAGHQIALNAAALTYMMPLGIASAAAVRVGHALGRGDRPAARRAGWAAIVVGAILMTAAGIVFVSVPGHIARIFTADVQVIRVGVTLLYIAAGFELFDGLQTVATGALRGLGDTRTPAVVNLLAYWIIGLPLGWQLCFRLHWGAAGLWIGLCLGLIVVGSTLVLVWKRRIASAVRG